MGRTKFGLALKNFTPAPEQPDFDQILAYSIHAEELGFDSLWVWDHILLGSKRPFPFLESLSTLSALASTTNRIQLGTGILVLPLRNPVVLAKVTSSIDRISKGRLTLGVASGWYEREFEAVGVAFSERGKLFVRNLDVLNAFWSGEPVSRQIDEMSFKNAVMLPTVVSRPRPVLLIGGYVDPVLRRVAILGDGWLTYFYTSESFSGAWRRIIQFAEENGRDPSSLSNVAQLPICIDSSYEKADRRVREFIDRYFDVAPWSESTADSAIRGTPAQCLEQVQKQVDAGVQHVAFVPCEYAPEQVDAIASEILPAFATDPLAVH